MNIRAFSLDQNNPILSHSSNYQVVDNHQVLHSSTINSCSKFPQFLRSPSSSEQPPPAPPLPPPHNQLHFSNNTPFWNASASTMNDVPSSLFPSNLHNIPQLHNNTIVDEKPKVIVITLFLFFNLCLMFMLKFQLIQIRRIKFVKGGKLPLLGFLFHL